MSDLSLYKSCLRKMANNLTEGVYKSCHQNPFSVLPSKIVDDIMSETLDHQRTDGLKADDLKQLLTSGKLRELKISKIYVCTNQLLAISQILNFLKSGNEKLKTLHLTQLRLNHSQTWVKSKLSTATIRCEIFLARLKSDIIAILEDLLRNTPNLEDFHCCINFDLKALRNCRMLRSIRLHFEPQQHWHEFLKKEKDHFQTHQHLEFFNVCQVDEYERIPYDDVVIILRYCPALTSLGFIESSEALSQLHRMGVSPSELKLRHCFWRDREYDESEHPFKKPNHDIHRMREAILHYPMIEELDFYRCCFRSIPCLKNLRNLVCLNIAFNHNVCDVAINEELQVIGPQLKHLSLLSCRHNSFDISLFLQNCHKLESLRIGGNEIASNFTQPVVRLPNLKRLTFESVLQGSRRVFHILSGCNNLTELFLLYCAFAFDDETLQHFLNRNSLTRLRVAYLKGSNLSQDGFKEFLLNSPRLEIVEIHQYINHEIYFERAIQETNHKARLNEGILSTKDEFFEKRLKFYDCECY